MPGPSAAAASPSAAAGIAEPWRDRLSLLLESTAEGIFGIDLDGRCMFANRAASALLGWPAEAMLGRNMHELIHHTRADGRHYPECDCPIFQAFRQGRPCRIDDEVLWRADGSSFCAEYASHPILGDGGEVLGAVVTFLDITARKRADAALREARDGLERRVAERTAELSRALDQLRELSGHLETVREEERTRIAREIHDELGSLLVALKMDTDWLAKRLEDRPLLVAKCHGMGSLIDTAVDNVGRIITDLRPSILDHQGLWAALEWQAQEFIETAELKGDVQLHVTHGVRPPEGERAIAVFRIFQEALSNIARHARATQVRIRVEVDAPPEPVLYIDVRDNGVGCEPQALAAADAWGVIGMRERAARFGGRVTLDSVPGQGTHLRLTMPLEDEAS
ncbi:PAS domain-containing protein [Aquabacterium sp. J223]|uniref:sensor histidine kinase n=1 Tax=Aquabacterium sp. J223 TaxID=2898431 RepID=UPI0021ADEBD6|nr:PAS domain-containing protein [Aquabacterium sp. J223]UUX97752.1 PAS domain-containing protein [Aquabacterium sp. J223]